jgi:hypothetical protein
MLRNLAGRPWLTDCLFLFFIEVLSALPYLFRLGFYTDDWAGQSTLAQYSSQGIAGLFQAVTRMFPGMPLRPVALAYGILEFKAFGHHPTQLWRVCFLRKNIATTSTQIISSFST